MTRRPVAVTASDVALLVAIREGRSVAAASRGLGISRDRAVYRLGRLARAVGGPVVDGERGGRGHGGTRLTELGDRLARWGYGSPELLDGRGRWAAERSNRLEGTYRAGPAPLVDLEGGLRLRVTFPADDGERVAVVLDPEAIVLARGRFASSARNVLAGRVESIGRSAVGPEVRVRAGGIRLRVAITTEPIRELGLAPGIRVWLYVKATALRRVGGPLGPTRGSPRR